MMMRKMAPAAQHPGECAKYGYQRHNQAQPRKNVLAHTRARQADQSQANCDVADEAMAILRAQREQRGNGAADAR